MNIPQGAPTAYYMILVVNIAIVMTKKRPSLLLAPFGYQFNASAWTPKIEYIQRPERRLVHVLQSKLTCVGTLFEASPKHFMYSCHVGSTARHHANFLML